MPEKHKDRRCVPLRETNLGEKFRRYRRPTLVQGEFGQKLDSRNFNEANDSLVRTYERFVATDCRRGGNLAPQGLVRLARMWEEMTGCFGGYRDELWDEDGDILNPREETQQSDGSLVILEHPELPCL